jgi:AbrB family looped-hinge helix DNA binding protein
MWYIVDMAHSDHYSVTLGERGRLVLPAELRRRLSLRPGDRLVVTMEPDGGFRVISARELAHKLRGLFADVSPGVSLADELIAERRDEFRREEVES